MLGQVPDLGGEMLRDLLAGGDFLKRNHRHPIGGICQK